MTGNSHRKELGDYQTPTDYAQKICEFVRSEFCPSPVIVIEPTCGVGNFLKSACECFPCAKFMGVEINENYLHEARQKTQNYNISLFHENFFNFKFSLKIKDEMEHGDSILVIGNPPWVTNAFLSSVESDNNPRKENFKELRGIEAMTGSSNFDICENIILRLIDDFKESNTVIAMLCKNSVARNIFSEIYRKSTPLEYIKMFNFNAKKIFGVHADACLLVLKISTEKFAPIFCEVFDLDFPQIMIDRIGMKNGKIFSNGYDPSIDGNCCFEWRQGLKHDCAKVMELDISAGSYINGLNEMAEIEENFIFPLIKSSHIKTPQISSSKKYVIVPQRSVNERTEGLEFAAPKIWSYLKGHTNFFEKRRSSIYKKSPPFGIFGVGDYSFSQHKVAISGFNKAPLFSIVSMNKAVMLDDTCYFIPFNDYSTGYITMLVLNSTLTQEFLRGIVFLDSKRPFTKKVLERIDIEKCLQKLTYEDLIATEKRISLSHSITATAYHEYKSRILKKTKQISLF